MKISGRNKMNRPYFFTGADGSRVEFPAMSEGSGDLVGHDLDMFIAACNAGAIDRLTVEEPKRRGRPPIVKDEEEGPPV